MDTSVTLTTVYQVAAVVAAVCGILGIPAACVWVLRRLKAANVADTKTAIDEAVEPLHEKIDGLAVQVAELRGEITGRSS